MFRKRIWYFGDNGSLSFDPKGCLLVIIILAGIVISLLALGWKPEQIVLLGVGFICGLLVCTVRLQKS